MTRDSVRTIQRVADGRDIVRVPLEEARRFALNFVELDGGVVTAGCSGAVRAALKARGTSGSVSSTAREEAPRASSRAFTSTSARVRSGAPPRLERLRSRRGNFVRRQMPHEANRSRLAD
jgi:hypothetical protein